jgi:putative transposase
MAQRPPRLDQIFERISTPIWFVTFNTHQRRPLLANAPVSECFHKFCRKAATRNILVGRFVIMPDHVHLFVCGDPDFDLTSWVRMLKICLSRAIDSSPPHWQEGFFDHLLRVEESYAEKWDYVRWNPVRAGLVAEVDQWPYQGEINELRYS